MIGKFTYSLTKEDYISFEALKIQQSKPWILPTVFSVALGAMFTYYAVERKSYVYLIVPIVMIIDIFFSYLYVNNVKPKRNAEKYIKLDKSYFNQKEITFFSDSIELKTLPEKDGDPAIIEIYPFSVMSSITESNDYFQFITVSEANVLPKKAIPQEMYKAVEGVIRKNPNYNLLKNV